MLEQVEERVLGPVQVLDEHDDGPLGAQLLQQVDPRLLEPVARRERVQVARDVEAERQAEDLAPGELRADAIGLVALEDPEVLLEDLAERPVGDPAPVGEAAAGAAQRLRHLVGESLPQLPH